MDRKKILLVDDEEGFTRMVKLNLESIGKYTVRVVNKGSLALEAVRVFQPDLILLDIMMPDMPGSDVAAALREDTSGKEVPIVFLTALVTKKETEDTCSEISGYPFIAKPVNLNNLMACIEKYSSK